MGLESATFINDLISTNPPGTDARAQGDDHLRLIKAALLATFKNFGRAFYCPVTAASQTSTVNVAIADQNKLFPVDCSGGAITVNLPQGSTLPDGFEVEIIKTDNGLNLLTIDGYSAETVNGLTTQTLWQTYQTAKLRYSSSLSAWLMKREYIPPKGEVTPWIGASAVPEGGFLFINGTTIGDASSSGTGRANADCEGLFKLIWAEYSQTVSPISGGRGISAAADWTAHKAIGLPNLAGRTWIGLDNLGGISDAGVLTATVNGANTAGQTNGEAIGSESNTLLTGNLPTHLHAAGTLAADTNGDHRHLTMNTDVTSGAPSSATQIAQGNPVGNNTAYQAAGSSTEATVGRTNSTGTHTHPISGSSATAGSDNPHANIQPSFVSAWKIKI